MWEVPHFFWLRFQWETVVVSWSEGGTSEVVGGNMMSSEDAAHLIA